MSSHGHFALILHAHLPFIRHPEHPRFLEEDWLFEAMTETYIPLLRKFRELADEGVKYRVTIDLTPTLCEMLADSLLQERYAAYLDRLIILAEEEVARTEKEEYDYVAAAKMYRDEFHKTRDLFKACGGNILAEFRSLRDEGYLEILGSAATHAFLPLLMTDGARRAQIATGYGNFLKHFGSEPQGMWLPECAYDYGVDNILGEFGVRYFISESHGVSNAAPAPVRGLYAPIFCPSGVAVFARDIESSKQVWSRAEGYPGDGLYREFYRDLGYDGEYHRVSKVLHSDGVRRNIGIKYCRITGTVDLGAKEPYLPDLAREKAAEHAGHFLDQRVAQAERLSSELGRPPIIVAPFDAELFGHWWYEGIDFIKFLIQKAYYDQDKIDFISPLDYLRAYPVNQEAVPSPSSWGDRGYAEVWINDSNDWIWPHLHMAEERMGALAARFRSADGLLRRALNQAARELVLAQASDWPFIMSTGTQVAYAEKRLKLHITNFNRLFEEIAGSSIDEGFLADIERKNNIFSEIDYALWDTEAD